MRRVIRFRGNFEPRSSHWLLALPLLAILVGSAAANPLPASAIFTHIQPPNASFCDQVSTMSCDQIVQYTEATGRLEFDVFFWAFCTGQPFDAMQFTATWPTSWGFVEAGLCNGAQGSVTIQGNRAIVSASWLPDCPTMGADAFLVARIVLDVTSHGELTYLYDQPHDAVWGCPPSEYPEPLGAMVEATAGVECDYCYTDCGFDLLCHPQLSPATLDVEVPSGLTDAYTITARVIWWEAPCTPSFSGSESWMSVAAEQIDWDLYTLTLTVDTQGLEPGQYSGWVIGQDACRGCSRINLTVTNSQGIEEPEDGAPPSDGRTWGEVKSLYR